MPKANHRNYLNQSSVTALLSQVLSVPSENLAGGRGHARTLRNIKPSRVTIHQPEEMTEVWPLFAVTLQLLPGEGGSALCSQQSHYPMGSPLLRRREHHLIWAAVCPRGLWGPELHQSGNSTCQGWTSPWRSRDNNCILPREEGKVRKGRTPRSQSSKGPPRLSPASHLHQGHAHLGTAEQMRLPTPTQQSLRTFDLHC